MAKRKTCLDLSVHRFHRGGENGVCLDCGMTGREIKQEKERSEGMERLPDICSVDIKKAFTKLVTTGVSDSGRVRYYIGVVIDIDSDPLKFGHRELEEVIEKAQEYGVAEIIGQELL